MKTLEEWLRTHPILSSLGARERERLVGQSLARELQKGELLALQGDVWPYLFLVGKGQISAAKASSEEVIPQAVEVIRSIVRENHGIYNPNNDFSKDDFKVMSQVEAADMVGQITGILTALLSSIAAIALIVGGIGIMNIMLVSVTERTREIGLRKAVGAKNSDILNQFLIESITLTVLGGLVGFIGGSLISFGASFALSSVLNTNWVFVMPFGAVILAFGVAAIVGLVFGIYPAKKAAKLSPIEALRHE